MTANVALTDTFDQWRIKSNELIVMTQSDGMNNILKTIDTTNSTSNTTGSIITAGGIGITKSVTIGENLQVHGNVTVAGDTTISGNLVFGDADTDQVTFTADINSNIIPNANLSFNLGNTTMYWSNTWTGHLTTEQKTDSAKPALTVSSLDQDVIAVDINAGQTTANIIDVLAANTTTGHGINLVMSGLTTGSALNIDSDSDSTGTRSIAKIIQNHASATGATALALQSDAGRGLFIETTLAAGGYSLEIDATQAGTNTAKIASAATTGTVLDMQAEAITTGRGINYYDDSLTTGSALYIVSDSSSTGTRSLFVLHNDNASATAAIPLEVKQDSTNAVAKFTGTSTIILPVGTSSNRGNAVQGGVRYNTTTSAFEGYSGSTWGSLGGVIDVDQDTKIIAETSAGADNDDLEFYTAGTKRMMIDQAGAITVGVDGTGHDVKFFGASAGAQMWWDESEDTLYVRGATADHATDSAGRIVLATNQAAVADGDRIGQIDFQAYGETGADAVLVGASIWAEADDTFDATGNETELVFATGASELAAEKVRITSDGKLGINTATPAYLLDVQGTVGITGASTMIGALTIGVDGTGHDVIFYGDTASRNATWDQSDDALVFSDDAKIKVGTGLDMKLYHSGGHSYITNAVGALKIATETSGIAVSIGHTTSETTINDNLTVTGTLTGTLATAAQGTVTSLGILTGLTVNGSAVFNETGVDADFRIESDDNANMFFVDGDQNGVGIGTSVPDDKLHIWDSSAGTVTAANDSLLVIEDATASYIEFLNGTAGTSGLRFTDSGTGSGDGGSRGYISYNHSDNKMRIATGAADIRMAIDSTGKVGIGTTDPTVALEIEDTSNLETVAGFGAADNGTAFISVRTAETQNNLAGITFSADTTTPVGVGSERSIGHVLGKVMNSGGALQGELQFHTNDGDSITQKMVITESGKVGIGTLIPGEMFQVSGTNGNISVEKYSTGGSGASLTLRLSDHGTVGTHNAVESGDIIGSIAWAGSTGSYFENSMQIRGIASETFSGSAAGGRLSFHTTDNGTQVVDERMTILHNGLVGIGTSVPTATLTVVGTSTTGRTNLETYSTTNSTESIFAFRKSGHATPGSYTATADDENLGTIEWRGVGTNANAFSIGAQIRGIQSAAPHAGRVSTDIVFLTGDASDVNEVMRVTALKRVGIGTDVPENALEIVQSHASDIPMRIRNTNTSFTGQLLHLINDSTHSYAGVLNCNGAGQNRPLVNINYTPNDTNRTSTTGYGLLQIGHKSASDLTATAMSINTADGVTNKLNINFAGDIWTTGEFKTLSDTHSYIRNYASGTDRASWYVIGQGVTDRWLLGTEGGESDYQMYSLGSPGGTRFRMTQAGRSTLYGPMTISDTGGDIDLRLGDARQGTGDSCLSGWGTGAQGNNGNGTPILSVAIANNDQSWPAETGIDLYNGIASGASTPNCYSPAITFTAREDTGGGGTDHNCNYAAIVGRHKGEAVNEDWQGGDITFWTRRQGGGYSDYDLRLVCTMSNNRQTAFAGSISKQGGSFKIDHPLPSMKDTHNLVHSFTESPRADLIYRDKVTLVDGSATVNIDTVAGMSEGTFVLLCDEVQCFTSNESDWKAVKGSVSGNILTIECEDSSSTADVAWMVIGDRQDEHMMDTNWTDENGKPIIEPLKEEE